MTRIAILHAGEMGAALGAALRARNIVCTTVVTGRSAETRCRAQDAGMEICTDLEQSVAGCAMIVALVPARAAADLATEVAAVFDGRAAPGTAAPIYLDANSTAPRDLSRIAAIVGAAGLACVDGAIFGAASRVGGETVFLLSGADAARAAALLTPAVAVRVVGAERGQASALKLALAVMTKGVVALGVEALAAARAAGSEQHAAALLADLYPSIWDLVHRVLPSYPRHIVRRRAEIADAAAWIESEGLDATMAHATGAVFTRMEAAALDPQRDWSFEAVIAALLADQRA